MLDQEARAYIQSWNDALDGSCGGPIAAVKAARTEQARFRRSKKMISVAARAFISLGASIPNPHREILITTLA